VSIRRLKPLALVWFIFLAACANAAGPTLEIYWIDTEGGGGTLIVTPAKQSILIDTGWPTGPSASRIHAAAQEAGIGKIDYLILTHFHLDHFGGAAVLANLMPIGTVLDNGIPDHDPDGNTNSAKFLQRIEPYRAFHADHREVIQPGLQLSLRPLDGTAPLHFTCMGAHQHFFHRDGDPRNPLCGEGVTKAPDTSENKNSVVSLLQFGPFKFYDGGDLTWNMEGELVCPINSIGQVDVYQVDHHGVNISNNPLLIRSLAPTVTVMNNGSHKGGAPETLATLRSIPSIQTMYQMHRDLRGGSEYNTDDEFIANLQERCDGNYIKCSVDASGKNYTISIPGTGYSRTYKTRMP
jgi:competence protein ComEC